MSVRPTLFLTLAALAVAGAAQAQAPAPAKGPSTDLSLEAAQVALATCKTNGYKVVVTVLDSAGVTRVVLAGDGAPAGGVAASAKKGAAVLMYKKSSAAVDEASKTDADLAAKIKADTTIMARAGAQPLISGGEIIGAIGVGGAPGGDKDDVCALAAVAKIKDRL